MSDAIPAKLSVPEFQARWAELVLQVVRPTLQKISEEYTIDPRKCASASPKQGIWVLEVPDQGKLCVAPHPSGGTVEIYEIHGGGIPLNSRHYALDQVIGPVLRERAAECFGPLKE
jgi:hypothetical protein